MTEWSVPAVVVSVVDGDTLKLDLDLGWGIWLRNVNCRMYGIDCPEMSTQEGKDAKSATMQLCPPGLKVLFVSKELDKYGRPLGLVVFLDSLGKPSSRNLSGILVGGNYAHPYFGGKR